MRCDCAAKIWQLFWTISDAQAQAAMTALSHPGTAGTAGCEIALASCKTLGIRDVSRAPTPSTPGREATPTLPSNYAPALPSTQMDTNCVRPMTKTTTSRRALVFSSSVGTICAAVLSMKYDEDRPV